jgi:hypothetical protein
MQTSRFWARRDGVVIELRDAWPPRRSPDLTGTIADGRFRGGGARDEGDAPLAERDRTFLGATASLADARATLLRGWVDG